ALLLVLFAMIFIVFYLFLAVLPSPAVFPYSTLFRSNPSAFTTLTAPFDAPYDAFDEGYEVSFDCSAEPEGPLPIAVTERSYSLTDRKSTRLNSSHGKISYALFCLIKKTDGWFFDTIE